MDVECIRTLDEMSFFKGTGPFFMLNSAEHEICPANNLKLLTIADSFLPNIAERENFSADKYEIANYC